MLAPIVLPVDCKLQHGPCTEGTFPSFQFFFHSLFQPAAHEYIFAVSLSVPYAITLRGKKKT